MSSTSGKTDKYNNEAFQTALQAHLKGLSEREKELFSGGTAESALDFAKHCDDDHAVKSKSRRFARAICGAVEGLRGFFVVIEITISARPEVAALVWGGVKFIIEVAAKYREYFDTISSILELINEDLSYYHEYATVLYRNWDNVQEALCNVYGDILQLCTTVHRTFKRKNGNDRSRPGMFIRALNPFSTPFDALNKSFRKNREIVERQAIHADRLKGRFEYRQAKAERQAQTKERAKAELERRAGSHERNNAHGERRTQSLERKEARHERDEAKHARAVASVRELNQRLLDLLNRADCSLLHARILGLLSEGSAQWIFSRKKFMEWMAPDKPKGKLLWCHGNAGTGKSFIISSIINRISQETVSNDGIALAYFYFNFREPIYRDPNVLLRSILYQLLSHPRAVGVLTQLATRHAHVTSHSFLDVELLIAETLGAFDQAFVVVDALDECEDLKSVLPALARLGDKLRLLVMSRDQENIRREFRSHSVLHIQPRDLQPDIDRYVRAEIRLRQYNRRLHLNEERIAGEIIDSLVSGADGMFLWAALQLDQVCEQRTDHDIRNVLQELPRGLDKTYERSLLRINSLGRRRAARCRLVLQWIIAARSPLGPSELSEAVAIAEMDDGCWQTDRIVNDPQALVDDCAGLCALDEFGVQLVHASVRDFLCSSELPQIPEGLGPYRFRLPQLHLRVAELCCRYIRLTLKQQAHPSHEAPLCWPYDVIIGQPSAVWHAKEACESKDLSRAELEQLLAICDQFQHVRSNLYFGHLPEVFDFALMVRYWGGELVQALINQGFDVHDTDESGSTPLHKAAWSGSHDVCLALLSSDALADASNSRGFTPMHMVAKTPSIIRLLLEHGGDIKAKALDGSTPLHMAARRKDVEICQALLILGVDPNCQDQKGATSLHLLARSKWSSDEDVTKSLIAHGATVSSADTLGRTPLHYAASAGNFRGVRALLDLGADANERDKWGTTPLHIACGAGADDPSSTFMDQRSMPDFAEVGLTLVTSGANICATDSDGVTPLHFLVARIRHMGAVDGICLAAMFATLSRAAPSALDMRDSRRRTPLAYIPRGVLPRLGNMLWRLGAPGTSLSSDNHISRFYSRWMALPLPAVGILDEDTRAVKPLKVQDDLCT